VHGKTPNVHYQVSYLAQGLPCRSFAQHSSAKPLQLHAIAMWI